MAKTLANNDNGSRDITTCDRCGRRSGNGWSFEFKNPAADSAEDGGMIVKCVRCSFRHRPLVRRSFIVAFVVGSILTLLNQGDLLFAGNWVGAMYWKIPLTYCVPYCVATYGALSNGRR